MCALLLSFVAFPQKSTQTELSKKRAKQEVYSFAPARKLLNTDIWNRVSNTRFECKFLKLAIEYEYNEYVLYEMNGRKLELMRSKDYNAIGEQIAENTFRYSSNYANKIVSNNEEVNY